MPSSSIGSAKTVNAPGVEELIKMYDESWIDEWYKDKRQKEEYYELGKKIMRKYYSDHEKCWTAPVAVEGWFKIKVVNHFLHGRIDRVDLLPDRTLEIIDYKTGKAKENLKADDKNQLLIYQIALEELPEYSDIGLPGKLTYYYLEDGSEISFIGSEKEKEKLRGKISETIEKIESGDFTATPGVFECKKCDYKDICEFRQ